MKRVLVLASLLFTSCVVTSHETMPEGWLDLQADGLAGWVGGTTFDPQKLEELPEAERLAVQAGWDAQVAAHWHVDGEDLVSDGSGPHLVTAEHYGDFELELEWKIQPGGDSGVYLRGYPQVQIWDPANPREQGNGAAKGSGGLWNNDVHERFPSVPADNTPGDWNHMTVAMHGEAVTVVLNGHRIVDGVVLDNYFRRGQPLVARGPIHLQTHGSEVRFRNVRLRPLD
ncbi:MAG: DUF1080 domain-containing protein [Planctomycetota bacterium]|nr:DUF1080 domain-containing protein [Planctomycetota bacterium]